MPFELLNLHEILVDDSKFSLKEFLFLPELKQACHIQSYDRFGIIYSIIVQRDKNGRFHLINGRKRVQYAMQNNPNLIRATVLPETTPITDIVALTLCDKRNEINSSVINKISFLCYALSLNVPESWILQSLCIPLELKPHTQFLRECDRIYNLPKGLKLFCHDKKFSLKQLINLTRCPTDILEQLVQWSSLLQLTASTLDEIASNLKDYLKRENKELRHFLAEPDVREILDSSLSPRDKTAKLRQLIHRRQYPVLSELNSKIQKRVETLHLPKGISIEWDRTLENKNLNISINISDPEKWEEALRLLKSDHVRKAIEAILEDI